MVDIDRNLLFGHLAVRLNCIGALQFAQAAADCAAKGNRAIADYLVESGWMSPAQLQRVEDLLDHLLRDHAGDVPKTLEAISELPDDALHLPERVVSGEAPHEPPVNAPAPAEGGVSHVFDETRDSPFLDWASAPFRGREQRIDTVDWQPEHRSRYTLTHIHGEGGLGQVWLALDPNLQREIALKNIRPDKSADPAARKRFIREAQITGQLEHPNIVPVYEFERCDEAGQPYYTMRFLRGQSLQARIKAYHERRKAGKADPLELAQLLNAFVNVCQAINYAAGRGVVHRDLKPQNVMLGDFGEVIVLDWGLAKKMGSREADEEIAAIRGVESTALSATLRGEAVGTPAYMAPEQAGGRQQLVDALTDVYGLGAILFAILTGFPPHRGQETGQTVRDTKELLKRIATSESPRPRLLNPSVPAALDAVCARAMAYEQKDRYASAADLARDVQRWLIDEPVSVYAEPWTHTLTRWLRRRRAWALSIATALVLVTLVASGAALLIEGARRREAVAHRETHRALQAEQAALAETRRALQAEEAALLQARQARDEAARRFGQARRAVDEVLNGVSDTLTYYPGVQKLRTSILEQAAREYETFAQERSTEPDLQYEFALALVRLGDVHRLLSSFDEARQAYDRALAAFGQLAAQPNQEQGRIQLALARCHSQLGVLHVTVATLPDKEHAATSYEQAAQAYEQSASILSELLKTDSRNVEYRRERSRLLANRGVLLTRTAKLPSALATLREAAAEFQTLHEELRAPEDAEALAQARIAIGELLIRLGQSREAQTAMERALETYQDLADGFPSHPPYRQGLADARVTLANSLYALGHTAEQLTIYQLALDDYRALIRTRPDVPLYRERLATTETNLAQVLHQLGRAKEAQEHAQVGLSIVTDLVAEHSDILEYHSKHVVAVVTLGQVLRDAKEFTLAETAFLQGIEKCTKLLENFPADATILRLRGHSKNNLGVVYLLTGVFEPARQSFANAQTDFEAALKLSDGDVQARDGLAWSLMYLGDALRRLDRADEAKTFYRAACQQRAALTGDPENRYRCAWLLVNCEDSEFHDPSQAQDICQQLSLQVPNNADYLTLQAAALYRHGQWEQCLRKAREAETAGPSGKSPLDFWRAMALWQSGQPEEAEIARQRAEERMQRNAPGDLKLITLRAEVLRLLQPDDTP